MTEHNRLETATKHARHVVSGIFKGTLSWLNMRTSHAHREFFLALVAIVLATEGFRP